MDKTFGRYLDELLERVAEECGSLDCLFTIDLVAGTWKCHECGKREGKIDEQPRSCL